MNFVRICRIITNLKPGLLSELNYGFVKVDDIFIGHGVLVGTIISISLVGYSLEKYVFLHLSVMSQILRRAQF